MLVKRLGNFILKKNYISINKAAIKCFTIKTDKLREIISHEIKFEKDNYSPVDENEIVQFKTSTKFEFVEKDDKTKMELKKTEGNYEVIVNFNARPPMNQEEDQQNPEESKISN